MANKKEKNKNNKKENKRQKWSRVVTKFLPNSKFTTLTKKQKEKEKLQNKTCQTFSVH